MNSREKMAQLRRLRSTKLGLERYFRGLERPEKSNSWAKYNLIKIDIGILERELGKE